MVTRRARILGLSLFSRLVRAARVALHGGARAIQEWIVYVRVDARPVVHGHRARAVLSNTAMAAPLSKQDENGARAQHRDRDNTVVFQAHPKTLVLLDTQNA